MEKRELQAFKMSMLPYLKSFYSFFRQLISLSGETSVEHISSLFLKIWSVISLLVAMEQDTSNGVLNSNGIDKTPKSPCLGFGGETFGNRQSGATGGLKLC